MPSTVWAPDLTLYPSEITPSAWQADTRVMRCILAGGPTGRPTSVVWHPSGARVTWQAGRAAWIVPGADDLLLSDPAPCSGEQQDRPNRLRVVETVGVISDEWEVVGDDLKHCWLLPNAASLVPEGAAQFVIDGRLILSGCAPLESSGSTAGDLHLFAQGSVSPVLTVARVNVSDSEGNATHGVMTWQVDYRGRVKWRVRIDADWLRVAVGDVRIDPTVSTSTTGVATGYSNQRKVCRFANGVLFAMEYDGANMVCRYSTDNGTTWQTPAAGATIDGLDSGDVFIDAQDYIHVVLGSNSTAGGGNTWYYRGTPNAGRTSYTWSSPLQVTNSVPANNPAIVAHQEGTGWKVHIVYGYVDTGTNYAYYRRVDITSGGTITTDGVAVQLGGSYTVNTTTYPSISADSGKNLYVAWRTGGTGTGKGIRCKKATYSSGSWSWGSEEAVDESNDAASGVISSALDSSGRLMIAYRASSTGYLKVMERGTSGSYTDRSPSTVSISTAAQISTAADSDGNLYVCYGTGSGVWYKKWTRATTTWGSAVQVDATTGNYPVWRRDSTGYALDMLYVTGSTNPYTVNSFRLSLNQAPTQPTGLTRANYDAVTEASFSWTHNDPDGNAQASRQVQIVRVDTGASAYDSGKVASSTQSMTLAGGTLTNNLQYQWRVMTWDTSDVASPWSDYATFWCSGTPTAAITSPAADGATVGTSSLTATGTCSDPESETPSAYQWRLTDASDAELWSTGKVSGTVGAQTIGYALDNATSYKLKLTVWDAKDIASPEVTRTFVTSFTAPPTPTLTVIPESSLGRNTLSWENPSPSGTEPEITGNDIYRRVQGQIVTVRIASGQTINGVYYDYSAASGVTYEYTVKAVGANGTTADSEAAAASIALTGIWLHDVSDPVGTAMRFAYHPRRGESWQADAAVMRYAGRRRPVIQMGVSDDASYSVDLILTSASGQWPTLRSLIRRKATLCARDSAGRQVFGKALKLQEQDELWGGQTLPLDITETDYSEEV